MDIDILGPMRASVEGRPVRLGGRRACVVLALLALDRGRAVPVGRLMDELWPQEPPPSAPTQVAIVVSGLRRAIRQAGGDAAAIETTGRGYRLRPGAVRLDTDRATAGVAAARAHARDGRHTEADALLREVLALWRGPALCGLDGTAITAAAHWWEELRAGAAEDLAEAGAALGRHRECIGGLAELVAREPLRERSRELLMDALARSGRRADALRVYEEGRAVLADQLGVGPGRALRELRTAIAGVRARPGELPAAVGAFTGRGAELAALDALAADGGSHLRLGAVTGPEGAGKTGLVVHWAQSAAGAFTDGQLFADLHGADPGRPPADPAAVLGRFLRALGADAEAVPATLDECACAYRTLLHGRRVLVVLDDAASSAQVRPLLPGSPSCCVLVTSRDPLTDLAARHGARRIGLGPLTPSDAADLVRRLAGPALARNSTAALRIADSCGRMPLGIRRAAVHLTHPSPR